MNANNMKKPSETNWKMVDALDDDQIDTSDIPPLTDLFFSRAKLRTPQAVAVTLNVDPNVIEWYRERGDEWEQSVNAALRIYAEAHKSYERG
jgi:uncharacterized protein (DUF4415 family)